jgi:two-component system cell cycle sensor histidine kinase PleC
LLSSAVTFAPSRGHIDIIADFDPKQGYRISASDNGIGIVKSHIAHILILFGLVANNTFYTLEGSVLGLSTTKSLTELHGGSLDISRKLGVVTQIFIVLPTHRKAPYKPQLHDSAN